MRPPGMPRRQLRVIATDFGTRPLRLAQEEKVVDRDHLRRMPRRHQQGMLTVSDVNLARQTFDRRRFEAMPRVIENADGDASIDHIGPQLVAKGGRRPIFPTAGEEHHAVVPGFR